MDDAVRVALAELCRVHGTTMLEDPGRLEAFLRDTCPGKKAEIHCLVSAVRDGAVTDLRGAGRALPTEAAVERLASRLREDLSMEGEASAWTAQTLADALAADPQVTVEPEPVATEPGDSPAIAAASPMDGVLPVDAPAPPGDDTLSPFGVATSLVGSRRSGDKAAPQASAVESVDDADQRYLSGDLRPGESAAPAPAGTTTSAAVPTSASSGPRGRSGRRHWIGGAVAVAIVAAVVLALVVTSQSSPPADVPPQPEASEPAVIVLTPTPTPTYAPPETVRIYQGQSLADAYREVAVGGTIRLGAGTYRMPSLMISDDVKLDGEGAGLTKVAFYHSASPGLDIAAGHVVARGIAFSLAGRPGRASGDVVDVHGAARAEFSHCRFTAGSSGVWAYGRGNVTLEHCVVSGSYDSGIDAADNARLAILDCAVSGNQHWGLALYGHVVASIRGCVVDGNSREYISATRAYGGLQVQGHATTDCRDSVFQSERGFGIVFDQSAKGTLAGNNASATPWGIQVQGNSRVKILSGNTNVQ